jgi:tRNA-dihydrouridine synthase B
LLISLPGYYITVFRVYLPVMKDPAFYVDHLPIYGDLILSPMDGFSDLPFRSLCRELGSAISYTEFVNVLNLLNRHPYEAEKLDFLPEERPVSFQIFDNDLGRLLEAALRIQELGPDIIDINMGCSVRCVSGRGAGAGLLRTPLKIARIFRRLSAALEVPLTGKIRLGWDEDSRNYLLVARIIEENGGKLIAVHGRTRAQKYTDRADWDAIAEVKAAVSIPVIANGDVNSVADIDAIKAHTGCDGVMIGRAAIGNPWIFSRLEREQVPPTLVVETILKHLNRSLAYHGPRRGLIVFRKHASRYITAHPSIEVLRPALLTAATPGEFVEILQQA